MNIMTKESLSAIAERQERERMAKASAENRFAAEQYLIANRKHRNRGVLLAVTLCAGLYMVGNDFAKRVYAEAKPATIILKSEIAPLNTINPIAEKRR